MELAMNGNRGAAPEYAREALRWTQEQDLSAPALGRLAERIGDLAARSGDLATLQATIELVRKRDRGRRLPTYVLTLQALAAAEAFARGDMARSAELARESRYGVYFSRSLNTMLRLEADARRANGETARADSLKRMIEHHQIADGDFGTWVLVREMTRRGSV
jgi:hypothetical protein